MTRTETVATGLPDAVAAKHAEILAAAESGSYEALRPLLAEDFSYSFGGPVEGGAIAYWQRLEEETEQRPIEILARVLRLPPTLAQGHYVWPFAFDKNPEELAEYERELLGDLTELMAPEGYLGWRAGITPDGDWVFFLAGD